MLTQLFTTSGVFVGQKVQKTPMQGPTRTLGVVAGPKMTANLPRVEMAK